MTILSVTNAGNTIAIFLNIDREVSPETSIRRQLLLCILLDNHINHNVLEN